MSFNTNNEPAEYTASAGQTVFPFVFKIFTDTDVLVYLTPYGQLADDSEDLLTISTQYEVTIDGDTGGSITLVNPTTNGDRVTIIRSLSVLRDTEYQTSGDLLAETLNQDQDYQTYLLGDIDRKLKKALRFSDASQGLDGSLPSPTAGSYLKWNDTATGIENDSEIYGLVEKVYSVADEIEIVGNNIPSVVTTSGNINNINELATWISNPASVLPAKADRKTYTATQGQTTFNALYTVGQADVWLNGSKLQGGVDFTATDGLTIVLTTPATAGDIVDITALGAFAVADITSKSAIAYTVSTVEDLVNVPNSYTTAIVKDLNRGGTFIWSSTGTANGGTVFAGATGYWIRQYSGAVNVKWFGAKGDGVTDDTLAIQATIDNAILLGGAEVILGNGNYKITIPLLVGGGTNITLRGSSNLESGSSKITCYGTHCFKFKADQFSFLSLYNISFIGQRGITNFVDQSLGGSWAWSTIQGCYILNFKSISLMMTGLHCLNNNFQNHVSVFLQGADYTFRDNYFGYDNQDITATSTSACVAISASGGVNFDGNYLTSMKTTNAPICLQITNSNNIRANNNWIDGGYSNSLSIDSGSSRIVCIGNRISIIYNTTNIPIKLSNVTDVNIESNIVSGLLASAPFLNVISTLKRCVVKDNIVNSRTDESVHGYTNASYDSGVTISGQGLSIVNRASSGGVTPLDFGKILTNTGATGLVYLYLKASSFKAGDSFIFKRTNTAQRVIVHTDPVTTSIYDSNTSSFNSFRIISYVDGSYVLEEL